MEFQESVRSQTEFGNEMGDYKGNKKPGVQGFEPRHAYYTSISYSRGCLFGAYFSNMIFNDGGQANQYFLSIVNTTSSLIGYKTIDRIETYTMMYINCGCFIFAYYQQRR